MTQPQILISIILAGTVGLFLWGRFRHDIVALAALIACVIAGLVPADLAFEGFGHPAVITVACVLVLSRTLLHSGLVDLLTDRLVPSQASELVTLTSLVGLVAALSAFMNNVGAFALLMPVAVTTARRFGLPPGRILMPLAFGSILGGMTTLIGTPPNLLVAAYRAEATGRSFSMFDFAPVGVAVALAGIVFLLVLGRFLIPSRAGAIEKDFDIAAYLTEVEVPEGAKADGMTLHRIEREDGKWDVQIVALVRNKVRLRAPSGQRKARAGDVLVVEAGPKDLAAVLSGLGLRLLEDTSSKAGEAIAERAGETLEAREAKATGDDEDGDAGTRSGDDVSIEELVVLPGAAMQGHSARDISLRTRYDIDLLAISRQGRTSVARLRTNPIREGDVLMVQGSPENIAAFSNNYGCAPLETRAFRLPDKTKMIQAGAVMTGAIALSAFGILPAAVAFAMAVLAVMVLRVIPLRDVYTAIDWPVVVLLGALIPVAGAMSSTGAAVLVAETLLGALAGGSPLIALGVVLLVTMTLSDFVNNAATAAIMSPIAIGIASGLGANPDAFLMAVAVGASSAFLTPIGHQNNALILGPGGFRFGDFWRIGLPLEIIVVVAAVPMIALVWPL